MDYGNSDFVRRADIADVKHFTEALAIMPHQVGIFWCSGRGGEGGELSRRLMLEFFIW